MEEKGVWRTIKGRRVFIREGEGLASAMKRSGKFDNLKREDIVKAKNEIELNKVYNKNYDDLDRYGKAKNEEAKKWFDEITKNQDEMKHLKEEYSIYDNPKEYKGDISDLKAKHISKEKTSDNWREQIKKNNLKMEKELKDFEKTHDISREPDAYYEIYRNNERRNAKIKVEVPTEEYEYVPAYAGYHDKSYKLAGTKMSGKDVLEYGEKSWTGKDYTNDEFMEHLEDANWHSERRQLLDAHLTNQEMAYIKNKTSLSQWGVGEELTGSKNVSKMIDEAKSKYRNDISPMSEYSDTTGTGLSDRQHTTLSKMSLSELRKTAQEYNIDTTGLSKQKLMAKLIAIFK